MKTILIAVPTNKYIETETFKSIYDLEVPEGYKTHFQYFYGYNIDQIRNLIADWAKGYDYLFSVDSDIVLPKDALSKMIAANKDIISGLYIQRFTDRHVLEIYHSIPGGGMTHTPYEWIEGRGVVPIAGCGFGCVLVKSEVIRAISYPHFVYKSALTMRDTVSEDTFFCKKARDHGFEIFADTSIICEHIGATKFLVRSQRKPQTVEERLLELHDMRLLPKPHIDYLTTMNIKPKVVYDIGACVLHWTNEARQVWTDAKFIPFEAMDEVKSLYESKGFKDYHLGVLSDRNGETVKFYQRPMDPGGNSYYKEVGEFFPEETAVEKITATLDSVVESFNLPYPDLIKMDVQGAELDILKGAEKCLSHATDLILELQHEEYNQGAPKVDAAIDYLHSIGFVLVSNFTRTNVDGDYHFTKYK
jgi:FkbM family methyltransferase